jgi:hypothetical protein
MGGQTTWERNRSGKDVKKKEEILTRKDTNLWGVAQRTEQSFSLSFILEQAQMDSRFDEFGSFSLFLCYTRSLFCVQSKILSFLCPSSLLPTVDSRNIKGGGKEK